MDNPPDMPKRLQELEKWKAVTTLRLERIESEQQSTRATRENFSNAMDAKLDKVINAIKLELNEKQTENRKVGDKRDARTSALESNIHFVQRKLWFAGGIIVTMQFVAPIILKLTKVL